MPRSRRTTPVNAAEYDLGPSLGGTGNEYGINPAQDFRVGLIAFFKYLDTKILKNLVSGKKLKIFTVVFSKAKSRRRREKISLLFFLKQNS